MGSKKEQEHQVAADQQSDRPGKEIAEVEGVAGAAAALDEERRVGGVVIVEAEAPEGIAVLLDLGRRELAEPGPAVNLMSHGEYQGGNQDRAADAVGNDQVKRRRRTVRETARAPTHPSKMEVRMV